ncbi:MAG TPA: hypothetical protein VFT99_15855, partial [Roseiflexaceae bacterium]|nr:hypothetical protein [Roseiflexaceae bacterium]
GQWRRPPGNRDLSAGHPRLLFASEDIEHGQQGTAVIATGDVGNLSASTEQVEVLNLRDKVWAGSLMLASWPTFEGDGSSSDMLWHVEQAWSATLIRGTAPSGGILAGNTGTVSSVVPLNGHYGLSTAAVTVPSNFPNVAANARIMAALAYDITGSRWEALPLGTSSTPPPAAANQSAIYTGAKFYLAGAEDTTAPGYFTLGEPNRNAFNLGFSQEAGAAAAMGITRSDFSFTFTQAGVYELSLMFQLSWMREQGVAAVAVGEFMQLALFVNGSPASPFVDSSLMNEATLAKYNGDIGFTVVIGSTAYDVYSFNQKRTNSVLWKVASPPKQIQLPVTYSEPSGAPGYNGLRLDVVSFKITKISE